MAGTRRWRFSGCSAGLRPQRSHCEAAQRPWQSRRSHNPRLSCCAIEKKPRHRKLQIKSGHEMKNTENAKAKTKELGDWRGEMLAQVRKLIKQADPDVVEEQKWAKASNPAGVP